MTNKCENKTQDKWEKVIISVIKAIGFALATHLAPAIHIFSSIHTNIANIAYIQAHIVAANSTATGTTVFDHMVHLNQSICHPTQPNTSHRTIHGTPNGAVVVVVA